MWTLVAWYESIDGAAVLHNITGVPDPHVTVFNDDIRVPKGMDKIIGRSVLSGADTALTDAILESPTLRRVFNPHVGVLVNALVFGNPPESLMHPLSPLPVTPDENLSVVINSDATTAIGEYCLVWFSDGPVLPIQGEIYTMRATAAITLAAGTWVNGPLTFSKDLPAGQYKIVGMRAQGTNLVAARLVFQGYSWRPGVPAVNVLGDRDAKWFRMGRLGDWGEFDQTSPPTLDCLGVTDTSQIIHLDLIKVG